MEKKINVAELLKDCPTGMELDCTMYDNLYYDRVDTFGCIKCYIKSEDDCLTSVAFCGNGCYNKFPNAKCVIFPKGKTTWEGFQRPFKDGDIIYICDEYSDATFTYVAILKQIKGGQIYTYCFYNYEDSAFGTHDFLYNSYTIRFATKEEKQTLFKSIKDLGYRWNEDTKTLDKLIEPKFKVGDRIRKKRETSTYTITDVNDAHYFCGKYVICDTCDNDWELVPDKFDITTLKPFESRVLVRDYNNGVWRVSFWGCLMDDTQHAFKYDTTRGCFKQCIPYEGNEHLLGKVDKCVDFYKTWK